jgi:hypothetical protein
LSIGQFHSPRLTTKLTGAARSTESNHKRFASRPPVKRLVRRRCCYRAVTCKHRGDVQCAGLSISVAHHLFRISRDNRQLVSANLPALSVSCNLVVLGFARDSIELLLYAHIRASVVELTPFERVEESVCRSSSPLALYFPYGLFKRDYFII